MTTQAKNRKIKKSYTLSPECVAFVAHSRLERGAGSDSEALELLVREEMQKVKLKEIEVQFKEYYDSVSDVALEEEREWARMAGRSGMLADDPFEARS